MQTASRLPKQIWLYYRLSTVIPLLNYIGLHMRNLLMHLSSELLATWPAHLHFKLATLWLISKTRVFCLILSVFLILSVRDIPSIGLSMTSKRVQRDLLADLMFKKLYFTILYTYYIGDKLTEFRKLVFPMELEKILKYRFGLFSRNKTAPARRSWWCRFI